MTLFRPEALFHRRRKVFGDVILAKPLGFMVLTFAFTLTTVLVISFLLTNQFTRKETAPGWIEPAGGMVVLRPIQVGWITEIFVNIGAQVSVGDPLYTLNVDVEGADGKTGAAALTSVNAQIGEITERISNTNQRFAIETERLAGVKQDIRTRLQLLADEIDTLNQSVTIAYELLQKMETLVRAGHVPKLEKERQRQAWLLEKSRVQARITARQTILAELQGNAQSLKSLPNEQQRALSELRQQLQSLTHQKSQASVSSGLLVRAPRAGQVMMVHGKPGQLRGPGQPVVSLAPTGAVLEASLLVPPSAIGFLEPGQQVNLMIDAFPFQKFGIQKGRIREISQVSFLPGELQSPFPYETSVYRLLVTLDKQSVETYGVDTALLPGMTLTGDLVVDRRTLFEWVFEPLFAAKKRS